MTMKLLQFQQSSLHLLLGISLLSSLLQNYLVEGHGYMKTPRTRNRFAAEEGVNGVQTAGLPAKEYCAHCLNRKDPNEVCGKGQVGSYDIWNDSYGNPMPWISQETYEEGQTFRVDIELTTNHLGHMELYACPNGRASTKECFESNPLEMVVPARGGPIDAKYPQRGYLSSHNQFTFYYKLPIGLTGDEVLLQWKYITGNSCMSDNYLNPDLGLGNLGWLGGNTATCPPLSDTGDGAPEQFWNCAEISITPSSPTISPAPTPTEQTVAPTKAPVATPVAAPSGGGTCGGGHVGNGVCADTNLCCSEWGWCGSSSEHCGGGGGTPCGNGNLGNGVCMDPSLCCSEFGWCGSSSAHCVGNPPPPPPSPPSPTPPPVPTAPTPPTPIREDDSRLIAYLGNWQSCPTTAQVAAYTHIVIAFAVSYTWSPAKNICDTSCNIATPPICNNSPNSALVNEWQAAGKKVILSFGGAGMGGSWAGDNNDCWEYCYGREEQVTHRLVEIVEELGLDGVDLDFEYHVTQNAVTFLNEVTSGLRTSLPTGSEITHAPMDSDIIPGKPYYDDILMATGNQLDFLMPQYYNGITRPVLEGLNGGAYSSALSHYTTIVDNVFGGDPNRMVFGFCISDCGGTNSNANGNQASAVMTELAQTYSCNGGAFFWVVQHDTGAGWSSNVGNTINSLASTGCSTSPTVDPTKAPTLAPVSVVPSPPTKEPTKAPTAAPTANPPGPAPKCCEPNENSLKAYNDCTQYYQCSWGNVLPGLVGPINGYLFDQSIQNWNWPGSFQCFVDPCSSSTPEPTKAPTASPIAVTASPTNQPTLEPTKSPTAAPVLGTSNPTNAPTANPPAPGPAAPKCCAPNETSLKAYNGCTQYYSCSWGNVVPGLIGPINGYLFDQNIQNWNWSGNFQCDVDPCTSTPTPAPVPTPPTSGELCCPTGYSGLRAWNDCHQYFHCHNGSVVSGSLLDVPEGTLFDQNLQNFHWADEVTCVVDNCAITEGRRLRGSKK